MTKTQTKTLATFPGMLTDYHFESDGSVWSRPTFGPNAGMKVALGPGLTLTGIFASARRLGIVFDSETKQYIWPNP